MWILVGLCLIVIVLIVTPAWPKSAPTPKRKMVGYDKKGNPIYEKRPSKTDFYA